MIPSRHHKPISQSFEWKNFHSFSILLLVMMVTHQGEHASNTHEGLNQDSNLQPLHSNYHNATEILAWASWPHKTFEIRLTVKTKLLSNVSPHLPGESSRLCSPSGATCCCSLWEKLWMYLKARCGLNFTNYVTSGLWRSLIASELHNQGCEYICTSQFSVFHLKKLSTKRNFQTIKRPWLKANVYILQ